MEHRIRIKNGLKRPVAVNWLIENGELVLRNGMLELDPTDVALVVDEVVSMDTNGEYLVPGEEMVLTLGGEDKE